jgi:hypothetical protein
MSSNPEFQGATPVPVDRSERRPVTMRGYAILNDGTHHPITLLDLSYEGCGIETQALLQPAQQIKLSVLQRGAIDAVVRWVKGGKAGLAFIPPEPEARKHWPRQSERVATAAEVVMRRLGKTNYRVTVEDLSPHGCKLQLVERPAVGEQVLVKFDGLEVLESAVCWVDGFMAGLKFERPMHPAVFDLLVERLNA